jgi:hypothetical protein
MQRFIVAEITKNWYVDLPVTDILSQRFEAVINVNAERGYKLSDWKFNVSSNGAALAETIIAIFELELPQLNPKP